MNEVSTQSRPAPIVEFWLPVRGYEGIYAVSDCGRVASLARSHPVGKGGARRRARAILQQNSRGHNGYRTVGLYRDGRGKTSYVHRLVVEAFLGPSPDGMEAAHGNGRRDDNRLSNLRWDTRKGNHFDTIRHGTRLLGERANDAKLCRDDVIKIRHLFASGRSKLSISKEFSVTHKTIRDIVSRATWRHVQ